MQALLVVAHGSRRAESNAEIQALTSKLADLALADFDLVDCAFLEMAEPHVSSAISKLVTRGATSVMVVPYFLAKGLHVATDIPQVVNDARKLHPSIEIKVSAYLGQAPEMPNLLLQLANGAIALQSG